MITFLPSDSTLQFTVEIFQDGIYENEEEFYLMLEAESGETAVEVTGEPSRIVIRDSDSECVNEYVRTVAMPLLVSLPMTESEHLEK